ncbi:DUF1129 family protein [Paenibacillus turpanensis]|uniref:DUF1129 family protein n=1 Tax=Paenibacillus turpanensis TaxID=2689078 RepID=UPI00140B8451|nr:DUF1129 family protein [Paenibacillus turpanensis]
MNTKELIRLNNEKRKQLTAENAAYYEKLLVYVRAEMLLSEQRSEELLMELLDHLLDAQAEGKSANQIFGSDPQQYCRDLIGSLPKENTKNAAGFVIFLLLQFAAWMLLTYGGVMVIQNMMGHPVESVYLGTAVVRFLIQAVLIGFIVFLVLKLVQRSIYSTMGKWKERIVVFLCSTAAVAAFFLIPRMIPSFGPTIHPNGWSYVAVGAVLLFITIWANRKLHFTK